MPGTAPARYAFLGPEGTFCEAALLQLPAAASADRVACVSVGDAVDAVRRGEVTAALVPLENSIEGSVAETLDELASGEPLQIVREVLLPVSFCLLTRPGRQLGEIRTVASMPHAEAQVRQWLRRTLPTASFVSTPSTAEGARLAAEGTVDAAIAGPTAAERWRLAVLAARIEDSTGAVTRFVLVARPGPLPSPTGADRTTLAAFIADDHPGALLELLTELAVRGVNLSRIESRPTGGGLGRYCFSLDAEGHLAQPRVAEAVAALRRSCADLRFLGSYPRADGGSAVERAGTSDLDFTDAHAWVDRLQGGTS